MSIEQHKRREVRPTDQLPEGATSPDAKPQVTFTARRRGKAPRHLADFDRSERKAFVSEAGLPPFRADQLSRHYFERHVSDPALMTDMPKSAYDVISATLLPSLVREVAVLEADRGETLKHLWELYDGARVESVLMRYSDRTTLCISSQAGCGMGCPFCATGQMGLTRNLSTAEIIDQVRCAHQACEQGMVGGSPTHLSNIVFMGMGEPLANYKAVVGALHRIIDPSPSGFGM